MISVRAFDEWITNYVSIPCSWDYTLIISILCMTTDFQLLRFFLRVLDLIIGVMFQLSNLIFLHFFRSYHDEEHYNSVRSKDDPCNGPAQPIIIKVFL